jgi:hypothetical protein
MRNALLALTMFLAGIASANADDMKVRLSPNPASSFVNIQFEIPVTGSFTVEVYTVLGARTISQTYHEPEGTSRVVLNTATLADGIYLVRVTQGNSRTVKRIKIQQN